MPRPRKPDNELTPKQLKIRLQNDKARKLKIREPEKQLSTKEVELDNKKRTFSSPKKAEDWLQKTIRMDRALFDLIGDTANSLGISDKEFCIQALKSEVQKHVLKVQKNLLAKIKALQAISKETSTN